jgi:hypothetical protein
MFPYCPVVFASETTAQSGFSPLHGHNGKHYNHQNDHHNETQHLGIYVHEASSNDSIQLAR